MKIKPNILVSITGRTEKEWRDKLEEIKKAGIKEIALFLELYEKDQREKIYKALLISPVVKIPLVHIRHDMIKSELALLNGRYGTRYFTIHEINFIRNDLKNWRDFYKNIFLEMNFDGFVSKKVAVEKIGGFCVDLAHFKVAMEKLNDDFEYVFKRKKKKLFLCNHLNGYDPEKNIDMHTIRGLKNFDYLKTLPKFVSGKTIALETFNSVEEQLKFKKYLIRILSA